MQEGFKMTSCMFPNVVYLFTAKRSSLSLWREREGFWMPWHLYSCVKGCSL